MRTALVWLRRDLRVHDHPALSAALQHADEVIVAFCLDRRLLCGRHRSGPRTQFMIECLQDLERSLRGRGSGLIVLRGVPEQELPRLARRLGAEAVYASADTGPFACRRDAGVRGALETMSVETHLHPGLFAVDEPTAIRTRDGRPQTVFTPYHRAWLCEPRREVRPAPSALPPLPPDVDLGHMPRLNELGLHQSVTNPPEGGEHAGRMRLEAFLSGGVEGYAERRNLLSSDGTSSLSPYLHFGCLSPREIEELLPAGAGALEFRRQLCWRDFYAQVLHSFPRNARDEHQPRYRGTLRWRHTQTHFRAWREGRTGYPIVDAAMRQLLREGWIPNRGRLISGSFLTKDLGVDWRWGERWFMRLLLDGDEASNNGNWQWIASVGVDPQPPARRLYNPILQQRRFDPSGTYVRRHVPELTRVPDEYLAEPWRMPRKLQDDTGCVIGRDYPAPIVEHRQARLEVLARFAAAREDPSPRS